MAEIMYGAWRKDTGEFLDQQDSFAAACCGRNALWALKRQGSVRAEDNDTLFRKASDEGLDVFWRKIVERHGGHQGEYHFAACKQPWLKKLSRGKLVNDKQKLAEIASRQDAERRDAEARVRTERRRLEADLKLAEEAGDTEAAEMIRGQLGT